MSRAARTRVLAAAGLAASLGLACAGLGDLYEETDRLLLAGSPGRAAKAVARAEERFGSKGRLLFHLELSALLHRAGRYEASNAPLEEAKRVAEDLYTRRLSREAGSFLVNDRVREYEGESFERAMVHVLAALNYRLLGDPEAALVEARQVDALLARLDVDSGGRSLYDADAFARYLTALLYEDAGRLDQAVVAYRQALAAYTELRERGDGRIPASLLPRALAAAERQSPATRQRMEARYGRAEPLRLAPGRGELVVVHLNGWVPRKREAFFELSFGQGWAWLSTGRPLSDDAAQIDRALAGARAIAATEIIRVAFPRYVDVPYRGRRLEVSASGRVVRAETVEDLARLARRSLEDRRREIWVRAGARAAFKFAVSRGTCELAKRELEPDLALIPCAAAEAYRVASEAADTRSWRNLPGEIGLAFLALPEGRHDVALRVEGRGGALVESHRMEGVQVRAGRRTFLGLWTSR